MNKPKNMCHDKRGEVFDLETRTWQEIHIWFLEHNEMTGAWWQVTDMQKEILFYWWKNWFYWETLVQKKWFHIKEIFHLFFLLLTKYSSILFTQWNIFQKICIIIINRCSISLAYVCPCQFNLDRLPCSSHVIIVTL